MLQRSNELGIVEQEGSADRGDGPAHARVAILIFRSLRLRGRCRVRVCRQTRARARARHGVNHTAIHTYSGCERLAILQGGRRCVGFGGGPWGRGGLIVGLVCAVWAWNG